MTTHIGICTGLAAMLAIGTVAVKGDAQTPAPYARTVFLAGLADGPAQWASAAFAHSQALDLGAGSYTLGNLNTTQSIDTQKQQLLAEPFWLNANDKVVLVGHSMGGLVARATAQARPNQVFGIVTVATSINGARIAQPASLALVKARIGDFLNRVGEVTILIPRVSFEDIKTTISQTNQYFNSLLPSNTPAIGDLARNSPAVQAINLGTGPNIPVAQVIGSVPPNNIHLRLAVSRGYISGLNLDQAVHRQDRFLLLARVMKYWAYSSLTGWSLGRKLGFAINAYEKIDATVYQQATGANAFGALFNPPNVPQFDGIVAADDAAWRGWGDVRQVFTSQGDDHMSVQYSVQGVDRQNQALRSIGVRIR